MLANSSGDDRSLLLLLAAGISLLVAVAEVVAIDSGDDEGKEVEKVEEVVSGLIATPVADSIAGVSPGIEWCCC